MGLKYVSCIRNTGEKCASYNHNMEENKGRSGTRESDSKGSNGYWVVVGYWVPREMRLEWLRNRTQWHLRMWSVPPKNYWVKIESDNKMSEKW